MRGHGITLARGRVLRYSRPRRVRTRRRPGSPVKPIAGGAAHKGCGERADGASVRDPSTAEPCPSTPASAHSSPEVVYAPVLLVPWGTTPALLLRYDARRFRSGRWSSRRTARRRVPSLPARRPARPRRGALRRIRGCRPRGRGGGEIAHFRIHALVLDVGVHREGLDDLVDDATFFHAGVRP